ncbi:hypothetical protein [Seonamhaeicola sp. ML3]|uniref:hypothetical protein n=1 Tax=Seonamhaeicola sp. ML3 TaxID=2937786 RepID=UPI00201024F7|nr:hypothetical protein [Seonamhaeicola sp. ML3]
MTLRELLNIAKSELKEMSSLDNPDFRLEQAEYKQDENIWDIVVSYLVENTNPRNSPLSAITSDFKYHRIYKQLKIDNDKKVTGFFIYEK